MSTSPYIYVNAPIPKTYAPPRIAEEATFEKAELTELLLSNDAAIAADEDGGIAAQILSVFTHPEVLFGDPSFIPSRSQDWIAAIRRFTNRDLPVEFVSMAFPYKSPNPLKTERQAPDLGEALMLRRFQSVLDAVRSVYPPGGRLTILEEGILGRCQGVDPARIAAYRAGIEAIRHISGVDRERIVFHSLDDMVSRIPNFEARWIHEQERLRELWDQGDPDVRTTHASTTAATRTSVPLLDYDPEVLAAAFDPDQTDSALRYVRDYVDKVSHRQFFAYRAILALRDATGYLADLRPGALKLTVSPKPENLAVIPVNRRARILPYHGVPLLDADGRWDIVYRGAMGSAGPLQAIRLKNDPDAAPIGYRALA